MTQTAALRMVIAAGGTGGHLYPGIAVARRFAARCPGTEVLFVGHRGGLEERLLPREGFKVSTVTVQALQGRSRLAQAQALGVLGLGTLQAMRLLWRVRPHLVVGAGGYVMGPVVLAATLLRVPSVILEQNVVPGLTVRALARCAQRVFTSFPDSAAYLPGRLVEYTGTPVREEICQVGATEPRQADGRLHLLLLIISITMPWPCSGRGRRRSSSMPISPEHGCMRCWSRCCGSPNSCVSRRHRVAVWVGPRRLTPSSRRVCNCCVGQRLLLPL